VRPGRRIGTGQAMSRHQSVHESPPACRCSAGFRFRLRIRRCR
jgi:hypothetical protein